MSNQEDIYGISTIQVTHNNGGRTNLLSERATKLSTAKVDVFSDSVLCLDKLHQHSETIDKWKEHSQWFIGAPEYRELHRIDRETCGVRIENFHKTNNIAIASGNPKNE